MTIRTEKPNVKYLNQQIQKAIESLFGHRPVSWTEIKFQFDFDKHEKQEPKTNWDEIMYYRALPDKVGHLFSLNDLCEMLTTATNLIPLYMKLKEIEPNKLYSLTISKRFRKKAEVEKYHSSNSICPILGE